MINALEPWIPILWFVTGMSLFRLCCSSSEVWTWGNYWSTILTRSSSLRVVYQCYLGIWPACLLIFVIQRDLFDVAAWSAFDIRNHVGSYKCFMKIVISNIVVLFNGLFFKLYLTFLLFITKNIKQVVIFAQVFDIFLKSNSL